MATGGPGPVARAPATGPYRNTCVAAPRRKATCGNYCFIHCYGYAPFIHTEKQAHTVHRKFQIRKKRERKTDKYAIRQTNI